MHSSNSASSNAFIIKLLFSASESSA